MFFDLEEPQQYCQIFSTVNINPESANHDTKLCYKLGSFENSEATSTSCPQLLTGPNFSKSDKQSQFQQDSFCSNHMNNLSTHYDESSIQRHNSTRPSNPSNSFSTKKRSLKRMMSFHSSTRREVETRTFKFNFLGQIYRKRSMYSISSANGPDEIKIELDDEDETNLSIPCNL
ncbi:unnamed protein product [Lepeophtheirus salmonis]|uniref:(salmon louse) hypothetical protein n=1 Tax=Lepeophtheirus salmonis TaxID=72036 RepID=A0A7R8HDS5_LEPSM|nr:unnamed protein product [Lepeophtheirus salmonis]CAF3040602.1 unnamed protein product [Lepeophtheirus salmonis]